MARGLNQHRTILSTKQVSMDSLSPRNLVKENDSTVLSVADLIIATDRERYHEGNQKPHGLLVPYDSCFPLWSLLSMRAKAIDYFCPWIRRAPEATCPTARPVGCEEHGIVRRQ